jgi:ribosome-associated heat shock protein Hsp15
MTEDEPENTPAPAPAPAPASTATIRIDKWLVATRLFKSRTLAQEACTAGHVRVNDQAVRASHPLRVGDEVRALAPRGPIVFEVLKLAEKRLAAAQARELYADHSPPPPPREPLVAPRERGSGRPTKADRRALERWTRR